MAVGKAALGKVEDLAGEGQPRPSSPRFPVMQCPDGCVAFGFSIVPFVRRHKQRILVLERNGVIQRVKKRVIGFDRKAGCPSNDRHWLALARMARFFRRKSHVAIGRDRSSLIALDIYFPCDIVDFIARSNFHLQDDLYLWCKIAACGESFRFSRERETTAVDREVLCVPICCRQHPERQLRQNEEALI
jgi:hypothetical protein